MPKMTERFRAEGLVHEIATYGIWSHCGLPTRSPSEATDDPVTCVACIAGPMQPSKHYSLKAMAKEVMFPWSKLRGNAGS